MATKTIRSKAAIQSDLKHTFKMIAVFEWALEETGQDSEHTIEHLKKELTNLNYELDSLEAELIESYPEVANV